MSSKNFCVSKGWESALKMLENLHAEPHKTQYYLRDACKFLYNRYGNTNLNIKIIILNKEVKYNEYILKSEISKYRKRLIT